MNLPAAIIKQANIVALSLLAKESSSSTGGFIEILETAKKWFDWANRRGYVGLHD